MPDPVTGVLGGATVIQGITGSKSARDATRAQERAARAGISEQQAARQAFEQRTEPFRQVGAAAATPILELLGISIPQEFMPATPQAQDIQAQIADIDQRLSALPPDGQRTITGRPLGPRIDNSQLRESLGQQRSLLTQQLQQAQSQPTPTAAQPVTQAPTDELSQINPLVSFLRQQGFEDIQESAAAQGRLRSGGTLRDLTEFNTQLTSTVIPQLQQQRFNQLFNLLGLGANAAAGQGNAALQTGTNISNLLGGIGQAQAQGAFNQNQAIQGTIGGLSGLYGAQQAGLFNRPMTPVGNYYTGTQTDFATGAMSSPVVPNRYENTGTQVDFATGAMSSPVPNRFGGF